MNGDERRTYERGLCGFALKELSIRTGNCFAEYHFPEDENRGEEAVDILARGNRFDCAVEHTLIESYQDQTRDDIQFLDLLRPLKEALKGRLPQWCDYGLSVRPGGVKGINRSEHQAARGAIEGWILRKAPTLKMGSPETTPDHVVDGGPPEVPIPLRLYCWQGSGRLELRSPGPEDLEEERRQRIRTALERKCPKLAAAVTVNCRSMLVLESNDIALVNTEVIRRALVAELEAYGGPTPDYIYLMETGNAPLVRVWVVKEMGQLFPSVLNPGPHRFRLPMEL